MEGNLLGINTGYFDDITEFESAVPQTQIN